MIPHDYTADGILEAAQKHAPHVDLPAYFEGRDRKGEVAPYVAPEIQEPVNFAPVAVAAAKLAGIAGGLVIAFKTAAVGIAAIFAFIEANAVAAGLAVMGAVALVGLSAARSDGGSGYQGGSSNGGGCRCSGTTIIQNNNFGGQSAEQNNGR